MIEKEKDKRASAGALGSAGDRAEEQMAFYLRRAFEAAEDVWVFSDLRIPLGDADAVQIDHLVVHRHGLIIIESKSVSSKVKINAQGEWMRLWNGHWQGMASPVLQAQRQGEGLRSVLQANKLELRERKVLGMVQGGFKFCPIEVLVAISDHGMFEERSVRPPGVMKAEAVPEAVRGIVERHRAAGTLIGRLRTSGEDGQYVLTADEIGRVCKFLLARHTARGRGEEGAERAVAGTATAGGQGAAAPPMPKERSAASQRAGQGAAVAAARGGVRCKACGKEDGEAQWGKYGYYLRCAGCGVNTALEKGCKSCGREGKIRKEGPRFWRECAQDRGGCGAKELVWENRG